MIHNYIYYNNIAISNGCVNAVLIRVLTLTLLYMNLEGEKTGTAGDSFSFALTVSGLNLFSRYTQC